MQGVLCTLGYDVNSGYFYESVIIRVSWVLGDLDALTNLRVQLKLEGLAPGGAQF